MPSLHHLPTPRMSQRKGASVIEPTRPSPRRNIVVFGESGVGKSSLINLIAGQSIAATSNDVQGCTSRHTKYELQVEDTPYAIWDTPGLDEGTHGTVPAKIAEKYLKQLLRDLSKANGIYLLVYCIRGARLRKTLLSSYNLFYSAICRKKVPIVAVVTGLETYEGEMEDWWSANEIGLAILKMHFDGHACVTTLDADKVNSPALKQRCHASRQAVLSLIASTCARDHWTAEQDGWVSTALPDVRAMFKPSSAQLPPIIALYDLPEHSPDPIGSAKDTSPFEGGHLMDVGGSSLLVHHIRDQHLRSGTRFKKQISPCGADLLIICASVHSDPGASQRRAAAFYESYGGDMRPLLVIARDALSDESAREWWNAPNGQGNEYHHRHHDYDDEKLRAIIRALPPSEPAGERRVAVANLQRTIQTRALQPIDVVPTGCFRWLTGKKRSAKLSMDATLVQDSLTSSEVWVPLHAYQ
ncbi:P-loop containing nucleoside triphosphate hydrolase protein [Tylopilus felleus]